MTNVFISYAREDESPARQIYEWLVSEGFSVWLDQINLLPGQDWKTEIEKAIQESDIFVACLSGHSVNKKGFVQTELKKAYAVAELMPEGRIYIVPIRLDDCQVPFNLQSFQWVNYFEDGSHEKILKAIQNKMNTAEKLEKELNRFLLQNGPELLKERFAGFPSAEIVKALLVIAKRQDELLSVRSRAVRSLSLYDSLDHSAWSEIIPTASPELFSEWFAMWAEEGDATILEAEHICAMLESRRLPKSSTGFGKAVRNFIKRGASYTSAVFLPGSKYPAWEVKYDCVRSTIALDDADALQVLAAFATMSYWQARRRIAEFIEGKYAAGSMAPTDVTLAIGILRQIVTDGKTEEKTPTMRIARNVLEKLLADQSTK